MPPASMGSSGRGSAASPGAGSSAAQSAHAAARGRARRRSEDAGRRRCRIASDLCGLERTDNGESRVVAWGSANGTFVKDQMVTASPLHNNDVVRLGKYTLWVGYEQDRRSGIRGDSAAPEDPAGTGGHTVV